MISIIILCCGTLVIITPTNMAFLLTIFSIIISILIYSSTASVFCASAVLISFSSGIIVVLCYCSISSNFEGNNLLNITELSTMSIVLLLLTVSNINYSVNQEITINIFVNSIIVILIIIVIFMAINAVNINILNPTNSIILTYWWNNNFN